MDGYSIEELKKMVIGDLHPENEKTLLPEKLREISRKGSGTGILGLHHKRKDGVRIPIEVNAAIIKLEGINLNLSIVRDITERKKGEEALRESEARFRTLSEAAFEGIVISDKGYFLDASEQFLQMFGYNKSELIGLQVSKLVAPESHPRCLIAFSPNLSFI